MIGMSPLHATSAKCFATASELIFGMRGGLIITAAALAAFARFVYSRQGQNPSAVVPATTGTRPFTCVTTVSSTRSRSTSVSRATSLVTPSAVNPFTPSARNRSMTRRRLSGSNSPEASKGVGRTENTPPKAVIGVNGRSVGSRQLQSGGRQLQYGSRQLQYGSRQLQYGSRQLQSACRAEARQREGGRIQQCADLPPKQ